MADSIWVRPIVASAEVDTSEMCDSCSALMVRLSISGLHEDGVAELPSILLCPDCVNVSAVVDEWRVKVRRSNRK